MIATDRLIAILLIWAFFSLAALIAKRTDAPASRASWIAFAVGILVARAGYVVDNGAAFAAEPWTVIALWQGGFSSLAGIAAAAVAIVIVLGRQRATAPLLAALLALWFVHAGIASWLVQPPRPLAQGIVLVDLQGRPTPLDRLRGRPFALNLWASWCAPCRRELPMLIDVAGHSKAPIFLVNQREAPFVVAAFLKREKFSGTRVMLDPTGALGEAAQSPALPTTLFVDSKGQIRQTFVGETSRAAISAALHDLEKTP